MEPPAPHRLKLTVQYDGSGFHGWQLQPELRTVQGEMEAAVSRLADSPRSVVGSGRTDTGVHATGQVASVDMPPTWTADRLRTSLNAILPRDVWIESVCPVPPDFHPRFDALRRTYLYRLGLQEAAASPFHRRWCWPLGAALDADLLREATRLIVGRHSFRAFAKAGQPERGEMCDVTEAEWKETRLGLDLEITADRYLHHMVRYLVGTMVDVARGRRAIADVARLLANEAELTTSPPAPPQGLYLHRVTYPVAEPTTDGSSATTRSATAP